MLSATGQPIPPAGIVERLKDVHPNLGMRFYMRPQGGHWWAIIYVWNENDPRWAWVQQGLYQPQDAVDVVCFLPDDCDADQAYGYFVNNVKHGATTDIKSLLGRVHEFNKSANTGVVDEALEDVAVKVRDQLGKFASQKGPRSFGGLKKAGPKKEK